MPLPSFRAPTLLVVQSLLFSLALCLGMALSTGVAEADGPPPEIAPYLLRLAPDSAVLCWVTAGERRSTVVLKSMHGRRRFRDSASTSFHRREL